MTYDGGSVTLLPLLHVNYMCIIMSNNSYNDLYWGYQSASTNIKNHIIPF